MGHCTIKKRGERKENTSKSYTKWKKNELKLEFFLRIFRKKNYVGFFLYGLSITSYTYTKKKEEKKSRNKERNNNNNVEEHNFVF